MMMTASEQPIGTTYLYHFDRPYRHAKHYLGWSTDHEQRDGAHRNGRTDFGTGARLLQALNANQIGYTLVRTWPNTTCGFERKLKRNGAGTRACPHHDCKEVRRARNKRWPKKYKPGDCKRPEQPE